MTPQPAVRNSSHVQWEVDKEGKEPFSLEREKGDGQSDLYLESRTKHQGIV